MSDSEIVVVVNGESRHVRAGSTVVELIDALGLSGRPMAVEVNESVVPKARLSECVLADGDRMEIVTLVGGG